MANFLLDQGANPHLPDWWGRTALYIAIDMHSRGGNIAGGGWRWPWWPRAGGGGPGRGCRCSRAVPGAGGPVAAGWCRWTAAGRRVVRAAAGQHRPQLSAIQVAQRLLEMGVDPNTQLDMHRPFLGRFVG